MANSSTKLQLDGVEVVRLSSDHLQVDVAPSVGGRIVSIVNRSLGHEFLWHNAALRLEALPTGSEYDPNFYGGVDELIPNDIMEKVGGVDLPDHGELWTTPLSAETSPDGRLKLNGLLPCLGLRYERTMALRPAEPWIDIEYKITNTTASEKVFLWKLHAALAIEAGDVIDCPARTGRIVDPAWSRFKSLEPFPWPRIEGRAAHIVPARESSVDFFYLYDLSAGSIAWTRPSANLKFAYEFDMNAFPYVWLFASYGGFDGHYTAVLEPCTTMPISLLEAAKAGSCSRLAPGASLQTKVSIYAGANQFS